MLEINYEKLLKKYNSEILTKTRAFNTDQEHLRFWVPSEDNTESVLNLIDSLKESKEFNYKIIFSKTIFNKENIKKLNLIFSKFSKYNSKEENNDYIYEFEINKDQLNDFFRDKKKIISKKIIKKEQIEDVKFVPNIFEKEEIKNYYIKPIEIFNFEKFKNFFVEVDNLNLTNEKELEKFSSDVMGYELSLKLEKSNLLIVDFSFKKKSSSKEPEWLNKFFKIVKKLIENKPLREIKEHATIYLVDMLRPKDIKSIGIIHPDNEGKVFYELKNFFSTAYNSFIKKNNDLNKYYKNLSSKWRDLEETKKIEILSKELVQFSEKNNFSKNLKDISIKRIEYDFKVVLNVSQDFLAKQKTKNYLLELEEQLKKNVDFRLEVFITMMIDMQKLRTGKSFKDNKYLKDD